jgi:hypothetical protein
VTRSRKAGVDEDDNELSSLYKQDIDSLSGSDNTDARDLGEASDEGPKKEQKRRVVNKHGKGARDAGKESTTETQLQIPRGFAHHINDRELRQLLGITMQDNT